MKFNCDYFGDVLKQRRRARHAKEEEKEYRLIRWHSWFAWFPVRVAHGDCRWLETIERKCYTREVFCLFSPFRNWKTVFVSQYRAPKEDGNSYE